MKVFNLFAQPVLQTVFNAADMQRYGNEVPRQIFAGANGLSSLGSLLPNGTIYAWGYNGQTPGPVIEVTRGDVVQIVLTNQLPEPTSLRLHGVPLSFEQSGQAGISEVPVPPGATRTYQFTVTKCGSYLYKSSYQEWKQPQRGLFGMLVFHCPGQEVGVTRDFSMVASGWTIQNDRDSRNCPAWWRAPYDMYMFNGHSAPSGPFLNANAGDIVRIRFLNAVHEHVFPISLGGNTMQVSFSGGTAEFPRASWQEVQSIQLSAGQPVEIIVQAQPGVWLISSLIPSQNVNNLQLYSTDPLQTSFPGGMSAILCVAGLTATSTITCNQS